MPTYTVRCQVCAAEQDIYRQVSEFGSWPDHCETQMQQVILPSYAIPDIQPYKSVVTGEFIGGRKQHREHLKAHNLTEVGNEKPKPRPMPKVPDLKQDMIRSIQQLKARKR